MTNVADTNLHFHQELEALEHTVLGMVDRAEQMVGIAVEAIRTGDLSLADRVVALDEEIDQPHGAIPTTRLRPSQDDGAASAQPNL